MSVRIAFVAPFGLGQKTTVWARILPLARELVAQGSMVTILIPPWDTPADSGRVWQEDGVQVINVRVNGGMPMMLWRICGGLDHFKPDVVHIVKPRAHAGLIQWLFWQRRRFFRSEPRIFLDIDDWEQAWASINPYSPLVSRFLAWQEEWGIRHADAITAASHWLVERVQQYTPQTPVLYLPNGISAPSAPTILPQSTDSKRVLFYSRYVEVPLEWLADFWSVLHQQEPSATLTIFGDALQPQRRNQFQQAMCNRYPEAADSVIWQAYNPRLVEQLYAESDCAIFPSAKTPLHEAKCSVKLATTLLRGIPVVASAVGEQQYYGAEGAAELVAADATPAEFAAAVLQVLADPQQRQQQQARAQQRLLQTYQWAKLGKDLGAFYEQA